MILSGCGLMKRDDFFKIENSEKSVHIGADMVNGVRVEEPLKLISLYEGNFVHRTKQFGRISDEADILGRIEYIVEVKQISAEEYAYRMSLGFVFPEKGDEQPVSVTRKIEGKVNPLQISKMKTEMENDDEKIQAITEEWVEEIIKKGGESGYEFQPMFIEGNADIGVGEIGRQLIMKLPRGLEVLIEKYPEETAKVKQSGGLDKYIVSESK